VLCRQSDRRAGPHPRRADEPNARPDDDRRQYDDPQVREKFATLGQEIPEPAQQTADSLRAYHKAEIKLWWPLIKAAGIKIE